MLAQCRINHNIQIWCAQDIMALNQLNKYISFCKIHNNNHKISPAAGWATFMF